jgi:hypothetical protein
MEPVSVDFNVFPRQVVWRGRNYVIAKLGLHHTYREGRVLYHIFSVVSTSGFFLRLSLNAETLRWKLEEVSDGL